MNLSTTKDFDHCYFYLIVNRSLGFMKEMGVIALLVFIILARETNSQVLFREYFVVDSELNNYFDGVKQCERAGGVIAKITNDEENERAIELINGRNVWIGLTDRNQEGKWLWESDGSGVEFFDWAIGQPDNALENEDCAISWNEHWADIQCGNNPWGISVVQTLCMYEDVKFAKKLNSSSVLVKEAIQAFLKTLQEQSAFTDEEVAVILDLAQSLKNTTTKLEEIQSFDPETCSNLTKSDICSSQSECKWISISKKNKKSGYCSTERSWMCKRKLTKGECLKETYNCLWIDNKCQDVWAVHDSNYILNCEVDSMKNENICADLRHFNQTDKKEPCTWSGQKFGCINSTSYNDCSFNKPSKRDCTGYSHCAWNDTSSTCGVRNDRIPCGSFSDLCDNCECTELVDKCNQGYLLETTSAKFHLNDYCIKYRYTSSDSYVSNGKSLTIFEALTNQYRAQLSFSSNDGQGHSGFHGSICTINFEKCYNFYEYSTTGSASLNELGPQNSLNEMCFKVMENKFHLTVNKKEIELKNQTNTFVQIPSSLTFSTLNLFNNFYNPAIAYNCMNIKNIDLYFG